MPDRAPRRRQPGPRSRRGAPPVGQTSGTRWAAVSVLTVALVLTGCSNDPGATTDPTSAAQVASPAASTSGARSSETSESDVVRARSGGFGVVPPEAWSEATDRAGTVEGLDLVLLSSRKVAGFSTNLVVLTSAGDDASVDAEIAKGREQMAAAGRVISEAPAKQVAGSTARGFQSAFEQNGVEVVARSYGLTHGGKVYLLTLSSAGAEAAHAMAELDEILTSWTWS